MYEVLETLSQENKTYSSELASITGIAQGDVSKNLNAALELNLVKLHATNSRKKVYSLTKKGKTVLEQYKRIEKSKQKIKNVVKSDE